MALLSNLNEVATMADRKLTTSDLVARWGVSGRSVTRYVKQERIATLGRRGLGGEYHFDEAEVERFEKENNLVVLNESTSS